MSEREKEKVQERTSESFFIILEWQPCLFLCYTVTVSMAIDMPYEEINNYILNNNNLNFSLLFNFLDTTSLGKVQFVYDVRQNHTIYVPKPVLHLQTPNVTYQ